VAVVSSKNGIAVELAVEPKGRHFPRAFRGLGSVSGSDESRTVCKEIRFLDSLDDGLGNWHFIKNGDLTLFPFF
jgi:hypothetical protein